MYFLYLSFEKYKSPKVINKKIKNVGLLNNIINCEDF